jgi:preprotein translocase subunit SecG
MIGFPFLAVGVLLNLIAILFVLCCIVLILIILIQKGKGGGLSSAFGGGMAGGILGSKTGDFLTWVTIVCVAVMLSLAVILAKYYKPEVPSVSGGMGNPQTQQPATPTEQPPQKPAAETNVPAPKTNTGSSGSASKPIVIPVEKPAAPVGNTGTGGTPAIPVREVNTPGN